MNNYRYQLVLQFAATEMEDFDSLVRFETRLIKRMRTLAKVDGHDFGSDEVNIFILTDSPAESFEIAEDLRKFELPDYVPIAAYRELKGDRYIVLSPAGEREFRIL